MATTVHCPQCSRELRVPDELIGKKVKCPACSTTFMASVAGPEAAAPSPGPASEYEESPAAPRQPRPTASQADYEESEEQYDRPMARPKAFKRGLRVVRPPAICLLVTGILGLLSTGYFLVSLAVSDRALIEAQMQQQHPARNPEEKKMQQDMLDFMLGPTGKLACVLFVFVNLIIILGSVMMLIGKMRWLAYMASILSMIDCCCCLIGIPFGIWSLIALNNPEAKAAFD